MNQAADARESWTLASKIKGRMNERFFIEREFVLVWLQTLPSQQRIIKETITTTQSKNVNNNLSELDTLLQDLSNAHYAGTSFIFSGAWPSHLAPALVVSTHFRTLITAAKEWAGRRNISVNSVQLIYEPLAFEQKIVFLSAPRVFRKVANFCGSLLESLIDCLQASDIELVNFVITLVKSWLQMFYVFTRKFLQADLNIFWHLQTAVDDFQH